MRKLLIKNGLLIDQSNGFHQTPRDILIQDGIIVAIKEKIEDPEAEHFDVQGKWISPGWIDIHVHNRQLEVPGYPTVDPIGVETGVTTVIEAGTVSVSDLAEFAEESRRSQTRYYGLLSAHSIYGKEKRLSQEVDEIDPSAYQKALKQYPGLIVGVKVTASARRSGYKGYGVTKMARKIAELTGLNVTLHIGAMPPDPNGVFEFLEKGDVVTHVFNGKSATLFQPDGTPKDPAARARRRGVLFDVGHGMDSFSAPVFDRVYRRGFYPDLISTDVRITNVDGPAYSLPVVLSKIMNLGMPLEEVLCCVHEQCSSCLSSGRVRRAASIVQGRSDRF